MHSAPKWLLAVSVLVALGAPGCARSGPSMRPIAGGDVSPAHGSVTLTVQNNNRSSRR